MKIDCPCCENAIEVTIDPGQEEVGYPTRNAQPGLPSRIEEVKGCDCWSWQRRKDLHEYENKVMERVADVLDGEGDLAMDRRFDEMRDEAMEGAYEQG